MFVWQTPHLLFKVSPRLSKAQSSDQDSKCSPTARGIARQSSLVHVVELLSNSYCHMLWPLKSTANLCDYKINKRCNKYKGGTMSSSGFHRPRWIAGLSVFCHLCRHCCPARPSSWCATCCQFFSPNFLTAAIKILSSSLVHLLLKGFIVNRPIVKVCAGGEAFVYLFIMLVFKLLWYRLKHWTGVRLV